MQSVQCSCGAVVKAPPNTRFVICPKCGAKLAVPADEPQTAPSDRVVACPNCGQVVASDSPNCPICGASMKRREPAPETGEKPKWIKITLLALVGVGLIAAAIIGMLRGGDREPRVVEPSGYLYEVVSTPNRVAEQMTMIGAQQAIQSFQALEGRYPKDLNELATADMAVPPPPEGMVYDYDPATGRISLKERPAE